MGASHSIETTHEICPRSSFQLPPARFSVEDLHFIPVTLPMANYILSMIHEVAQLCSHPYDTLHSQNAPNYTIIIKHRLEHFNVIQQNIIDNKYKNVGEILDDIDNVWKSMYELTSTQTRDNKQHDPKSDFITFAAGIESEFYNLWDEFDKLLVKKGYLKGNTPLSSSSKYFISNKTEKENDDNGNSNSNNTNHTDVHVDDHKEEDIDNDHDEFSIYTIQQDLKDWFTNTVKLPQYYDVFVSNGFDDLSFVIGIIRESDLKQMKIEKIGHRRKILALADSPDHRKRKSMTEIDDVHDNQESVIDHDDDDVQQPQRKRHRTSTNDD